MVELTGQDVVQRPEHRFSIKVLLYAVWIFSGLLFWHAGYALCAPVDPEASLSWASGGRILAGYIPVTLLVAATAAVATAIAGRWVVDAGVFAAAVGLTAMSTRGGTVEHLLLRRADVGLSGSGLAVSFAGEALAWIATLALAAWVADRVTRILGLSSPRQDEAVPRALSMVGELSRLGSGSASARRRLGLVHLAVAAAVTGAMTIVFCIDLARRPVSHGQAIFVCSASAWLATYFTFKRFPVRSALYPVIGALAACVGGYLIAMLSGAKADLPPNLPVSPFLRALPLQAVAGSVGGALLGFWFAFDPGMVAAHQEPTAATPASDTSRKGPVRR